MNIFDEINEVLETKFTREEILNLNLDTDYLESLDLKRIDFCYDPDFFSGYTKPHIIEQLLINRIDLLNWINVFESIRPLKEDFIDFIWSRIKNKYNDNYKYGIVIKTIVSNNIVSNNFITEILNECIQTSKYDIIKYILKHQKLKEHILDKYMEILDEDGCNVEICMYQDLSEKFIKKYYEILDLGLVVKYQNLSKDFIISHEELLGLAITKGMISEDEIDSIWENKISGSRYLKEIISKDCEMSREFINCHGAELDWSIISRNIKVSLETLIYYKHLIHWNYVFDNYIDKKRSLVSKDLERLITENIIADKQSVCEMMRYLSTQEEINKFCEFFREYYIEDENNEN